MKKEEIIITVSGPHGTGKSLHSKELAKRYGLRLISTGNTFREKAAELELSLDELNDLARKDRSIDIQLDSYMVREAKKGGVVADGRLTGWLIMNEAHIRIYLIAPLEERIRRIAVRDGITLDDARKETLDREGSERTRFKDYYDIDVNDLSIYNVILDTSLVKIENMKRILREIVDGYIGSH